jgi:hypothetical protein
MFILNCLGNLALSRQNTARRIEMAEEKTKEIKEMAEKASDLAKNIWLAGLGAYGKAFDEAQGTYQKVTDKVKQAQESTKMFDDLVEKGKELEGETQGQLQEVKEKANVNLEERLSKVKESLTFNFKKSSDSDDLLGEISTKLDLVLSALETKETKAPAKKTATRKAAASKTA